VVVTLAVADLATNTAGDMAVDEYVDSPRSRHLMNKSLAFLVRDSFRVPRLTLSSDVALAEKLTVTGRFERMPEVFDCGFRCIVRPYNRNHIEPCRLFQSPVFSEPG